MTEITITPDQVSADTAKASSVVLSDMTTGWSECNPHFSNINRYIDQSSARISEQDSEIERLRAALKMTQAENDETYEIGKRDGYSEAVQEIDCLTGGDGEYRFCTDHDPERHTPDPATMISRIVARFDARHEALRQALTSVGHLPTANPSDLADHEPNPLPDRAEWRPIETAPHGVVVWVSFWKWNKPDTERGVVMAALVGGTWQQHLEDCEVWPPTHWMPCDPPVRIRPAPPLPIPHKEG